MIVDVRPMQIRDIPAVRDLQRRCFPGIEPWSEENLRAQLRRFAEGQIVATIDGRLVATSSSLIVRAEAWERPHSFAEVSDHGRIGTHDPEGDALYGIDIAVDPRVRGMRLARRIYEARKEVIRERNLRAFLIAGRIPGLAAHGSRLDAAAYVRKVVAKELTDPVLTTQLANGFAIRAILPNYLPCDQESLGHAVFMAWLSPDHVPSGSSRSSRVRVAAAQVRFQPMADWESFARQVAFFADAAGDQRADFLVLPELLIGELQPTAKGTRPGLVARELATLHPRYADLCSSLAVRHDLNLVAGSVYAQVGRNLRNLALVCRRDGTVAEQAKLHISPPEERWLGLGGGDSFGVIETDRCRIALLTGFDAEFPELARMAAHAGADICFTPCAVERRQAFLRLRTCAHANAISNGMFAVVCGGSGSMPQLHGSDLHYAQSCILTPLDPAFPQDGVLAEADSGAETLLVQDLDLTALRRCRMHGGVRPWDARRRDLYRLRWFQDQRAKQI